MIGKRKLARLSKKIDALLDSETPESLNKWLDDYRRRKEVLKFDVDESGLGKNQNNNGEFQLIFKI